MRRIRHVPRLWRQPDKQKAYEFLIDWIYRAGSSDIDILGRFAQTLATHLDGILAYCDCRISAGPLEGTNNKIKPMKRQAYGFRDIEFSQTQNHGYSRYQVRFSRMSRKFQWRSRRGGPKRAGENAIETKAGCCVKEL